MFPKINNGNLIQKKWIDFFFIKICMARKFDSLNFSNHYMLSKIGD